MASRLSTLGKRIGKMPPRIGQAEGDRAGQDRQREQINRWRKWYRTPRWSALRLDVLKRDGWRCVHTGAPLTGKGNDPSAPVIHHKEPHKGDERLFWDAGNLEAVSKAWHDSQGQKSDKSKGHW